MRCVHVPRRHAFKLSLETPILSRNMRKSTFWSALNDDSNQHAQPGSLIRVFILRMKKLSKMRLVEILIRLCGLRECPGWSEFLLGAHDRKYVFWRCGANYTAYKMSRDTAFPTRLHVRPAKTDQPAHLYCLIRVFEGHSVSSQEYTASLGGQQRLRSACSCAGWSESSLGARVIL